MLLLPSEEEESDDGDAWEVDFNDCSSRSSSLLRASKARVTLSPESSSYLHWSSFRAEAQVRQKGRSPEHFYR